MLWTSALVSWYLIWTSVPERLAGTGAWCVSLTSMSESLTVSQGDRDGTGVPRRGLDCEYSSSSFRHGSHDRWQGVDLVPIQRQGPLPPNLQFRLGDASVYLQFPQDEFDVVHARGMLFSVSPLLP